MKKVLSFVLVLTLVLGSFSMVFAAPEQKGLSDIAGSVNEEAIQVVNDLGIITGYDDGTFKGANNVTRAEFAAMITRALAIPESALAGYSTSTFKDTAGYGWAVPYLAFCQSKGIMIGDGNGNAMPGRTVTVNEAMTMVLRAIGYTNNSALLVGSWPANYVSLGQTLGLYDDVAAATTINRESAAQVVYNVLTVALVQVATDGKTDKVVAEKFGNETIYRTLLTSGLGCDIDKKGAAYVITGEEPSAINLMPYQGTYAVTYSKDDEIVAIGEVKSTFLTGDVDAEKKLLM
ncbi:MAG: S-layer homology domain-containing protein [Firmicutes bacterium]|nr:S-layer homology domain-containing protein [Bacillota bacterium]